jgi:hypothetical protein
MVLYFYCLTQNALFVLFLQYVYGIYLFNGRNKGVPFSISPGTNDTFIECQWPTLFGRSTSTVSLPFEPILAELGWPMAMAVAMADATEAEEGVEEEGLLLELRPLGLLLESTNMSRNIVATAKICKIEVKLLPFLEYNYYRTGA